MQSEIAEKLKRSFALWEELVSELPEAAFREPLPGIPSNTVGQQLWCVVGARESYFRAIKEGAWAGFSCSLDSEGCVRRESLSEALAQSAEAMIQFVQADGEWSSAQSGLILDLLEHEAAHQGQLIRYLYGLKLPIPGGWKARYALA